MGANWFRAIKYNSERFKRFKVDERDEMNSDSHTLCIRYSMIDKKQYAICTNIEVSREKSVYMTFWSHIRNTFVDPCEKPRLAHTNRKTIAKKTKISIKMKLNVEHDNFNLNKGIRTKAIHCNLLIFISRYQQQMARSSYIGTWELKSSARHSDISRSAKINL